MRPAYELNGDSAPVTSPSGEAGRRPLRADARRNRERLLQAAAAAFAADGLSVPLDEIARRAGVGPGTLYRHFPAKEDLFAAVLHDRLQRLADEARDLRSAGDPAGALLGFIGRLVTEAALKRDLADALARSGLALPGGTEAVAADLRAGIGHLLTRAQDGGGIRGDVRLADLMGLIAGTLLAIQARTGAHADPRVVMAVLADGLRAVPG
ncbi:MAG: TetR/AcrR family transcriptional regulator [Streptosporangiales bacterium]